VLLRRGHEIFSSPTGIKHCRCYRRGNLRIFNNRVQKRKTAKRVKIRIRNGGKEKKIMTVLPSG
jgi:hypothetical protein